MVYRIVIIFLSSAFAKKSTAGFFKTMTLTLSVPDVISGRGDVGLITLVDVYFAKITLRV